MAPPLGELARPQAVTERALSASLCSAPPPKGEALLRCRTTCPVEWCGAPGGFGTRPYEVRIGVAVVRQGPGNPAPARWNCSFLSLRGAKRRGNPHPLWGVPGRRKGERIPTAACGRLGMTKPGDGAINHLRGRTTCPVEWCGAPGGFGTRPYEVRIGAAVSGKGRGTRPLPGGTVRFCHCEERSDAAIRIPFGAFRDAEKGNGFPRQPAAASE